MASRKRRQQPIVTKDGDAYVIDTGIFTTKYSENGVPEHRPVSALEALRRIHAQALKMSQPGSVKDGRVLTAELEDGSCIMLIGHDVPWTASELASRLWRFLATDPCERLAEVFLEGLECGQKVAKIQTLQREPDALRGKIQKQAAVKAGKASAKLTAGQRIAARIERDELIEQGHSKQGASRIISERLGVSYKTVERL